MGDGCISSVLPQPYFPPAPFHNYLYRPRSHCSDGMASSKQYKTVEKEQTRWVAGPQCNHSCQILELFVGEYIPICEGKRVASSIFLLRPLLPSGPPSRALR